MSERKSRNDNYYGNFHHDSEEKLKLWIKKINEGFLKVRISRFFLISEQA